MSATWDEIRVAALQKMFLINGASIEVNDGTKSYLAAMPWAYNEAIELLSTTSRYINKEYAIGSIGTGGYVTIRLRRDIPSFYQLQPNGVYRETQNGLAQTYNYMLYGDDFLVLPSVKGTYHIFYRAYPLKATPTTTGDTDMQLDDDVAAIIPLYIASQLYKDDDIAIATTYRNEFEVAREELLKDRNGSVAAEFSSKTGWW